MRARLDLPNGSVTGPVFAIGGHLGGEALYLKAGKPVFTLNTMAGENTSILASEALPAGVTELQLRFDRPKGGDAAVTISASGRVLASGTVPAATLQAFSATELFGVGIDSGTAVLPGAEADVHFPGGIGQVTFDFTGKP
jgi:arylsulfatase